MTPTVAKASAGAVEHLPVARIDSVAGFILEARDAGRIAVGADQEGAEDYRDLAWPDDPVLVMGAEGAGLRPRVRAACDHLVASRCRGAWPPSTSPWRPESCSSGHFATPIDGNCGVLSLTPLCADDNNAQPSSSQHFSSA